MSCLDLTMAWPHTTPFRVKRQKRFETFSENDVILRYHDLEFFGHWKPLQTWKEKSKRQKAEVYDLIADEIALINQSPLKLAQS